MARESSTSIESGPHISPSLPILTDFTKSFVLQTDARDFGVGAVLTPEDEVGKRVISYASRKLTMTEGN